MVRVTVDKLVELQKSTKNIRNICILAHVDHGKTTLADTLIASNEIISQRLAGQLRYMDSRPDEQERQITMKSSSISLYFHEAEQNNDYLVNLIDSPGHVDFSSEVSTAVRLCDGGIIVVDAVEGVCAQTRICLAQAYNESLHTILFINKIDRLIFEMNLSPEEAYRKITQIVEQVNAVLGNIFASDILKQDTETQQSALEDSDDSNLYFEPHRNVIFGSALDNWGFTLQDFAKMYANKFNVDPKELLDGLWGDFYFNASTKTCKPGAFDKGKKPMFVSLILDPIWKIYLIARDKQATEFEAFSAKLGVKLARRELNFTDPKVPIKATFSQWLPLDKAILNKVVKLMPGPQSIPQEKIFKLMSTNVKNFENLHEKTKEIKVSLSKCDPSSSTVVVFVSKMFSVDVKTQILGLNKFQGGLQEDPGDTFVAFARVYSGTLRKGMKLLVLGPKHNQQNFNEVNNPHVTEFEVNDLYLMMGRGLEAINEVPAGTIVGIGGLENIIHKTATISSTPYCPPFVDLPVIATPILRVAVEPKSLAHMNKLIAGLKLLNQADPCVQVMVQDTGEHVLLTLGEVHLDRCIKDLQETFAKCELNVSKPIVPFRETIVKYVPPESDEPEVEKVEDKSVILQTPNKLCTIKLLGVPIPETAQLLMDKYFETIKNFVEGKCEIPEKVKEELQRELQQIDEFKELKQIWSIGSRKVPLNLLINCTDYENTSAFVTLKDSKKEDQRSLYDNSFIQGFQLTTQAGPICEEAMQGVAFLVQDYTITESDDNQYGGVFSGQIISTVKEGCKRAFQNQPQRLVSPMYSCTIVVDSNVLNKMYAVIGKRHGHIISADLIDGSGQFSVTANLPVIESFDFAGQIRTETSGLAMPQLVFSHWEVIDQDPYWVPKTKDEIEHYGEKGDAVVRAKTYMDSVRERKGLHVEKLIVEHAEKQRTLSKNK